MKIIEDASMLAEGPKVEKVRTFKERLFSWHWFKKTKKVRTWAPSKQILQLSPGVFVAHPETVRRFQDHTRSLLLHKPINAPGLTLIHNVCQSEAIRP